MRTKYHREVTSYLSKRGQIGELRVLLCYVCFPTCTYYAIVGESVLKFITAVHCLLRMSQLVLEVTYSGTCFCIDVPLLDVCLCGYAMCT